MKEDKLIELIESLKKDIQQVSNTSVTTQKNTDTSAPIKIVEINREVTEEQLNKSLNSLLKKAKRLIRKIKFENFKLEFKNKLSKVLKVVGKSFTVIAVIAGALGLVGLAGGLLTSLGAGITNLCTTGATAEIAKQVGFTSLYIALGGFATSMLSSISFQTEDKLNEINSIYKEQKKEELKNREFLIKNSLSEVEDLLDKLLVQTKPNLQLEEGLSLW